MKPSSFFGNSLKGFISLVLENKKETCSTSPNNANTPVMFIGLPNWQMASTEVVQRAKPSTLMKNTMNFTFLLLKMNSIIPGKDVRVRNLTGVF